jgi:hypothetical protein
MISAPALDIVSKFYYTENRYAKTMTKTVFAERKVPESRDGGSRHEYICGEDHFRVAVRKPGIRALPRGE